MLFSHRRVSQPSGLPDLAGLLMTTPAAERRSGPGPQLGLGDTTRGEQAQLQPSWALASRESQS